MKMYNSYENSAWTPGNDTLPLLDDEMDNDLDLIDNMRFDVFDGAAMRTNSLMEDMHDEFA